MSRTLRWRRPERPAICSRCLKLERMVRTLFELREACHQSDQERTMRRDFEKLTKEPS